jgi:hypothetical protein
MIAREFFVYNIKLIGSAVLPANSIGAKFHAPSTLEYSES